MICPRHAMIPTAECFDRWYENVRFGAASLFASDLDARPNDFLALASASGCRSRPYLAASLCSGVY